MDALPLPAGGRPIDEEEAERRWSGWTPHRVAAALDGVTVPWCVSAGWALDLFLGEVTRPHGDIEIAVPRAGFDEIAAAFGGFAWDVVGDGMIWSYADAHHHPELHQTWLRDPATGRFHLDVFREPHDGDRWICRRDPSITMPYAELIETGADGIPYVVPEVALLFKARARRAKDDRDFAGVLPLLSESRRVRLAGWLTRLYPGHGWLAELGRAPSSR